MAKKHNNDLSLGLASKGLTELHNLNGRCAVVTGGAQGCVWRRREQKLL